MHILRHLGLAVIFLFIQAQESLGQEKSFPFVFLNPNPNKITLPKDIVDTLQARHMRNITRLAQEKKLLAAGPFYDGGGIFVFGEYPVDSVRVWLKTDPAVLAERWIIEYLNYRPITGSICNVGETYTMVTYGYARVSGLEKNSEVAGMKELMKGISRKDTVIAAGAFAGNGDGILVFRNAPTDSSVSATWVMGNSNWKITTRKLYIAKGSFCEE